MIIRLLRRPVGALGLLFAALLMGCSDDPSPVRAGTPPGPQPGIIADQIVSIVPGAQYMTNDAYSPASAEIIIGQTVAWRNDDDVPHTATANDGSWNTGEIAPGAFSDPVTFSDTGEFNYHCTLHPAMTGKVQVSD